MEANYGDLEYLWTDCRKTSLLRNFILGVSTEQSSACNSEAIAAIHNPSGSLSTPIISFGFSMLVLQNYECNNSGRHLLDEVSSKGNCAVFCSGLYRACMGVTTQYKALISPQMDVH